MCWPSARGGAFLAVGVFLYRAVMVAVSMISSSITGRKTTYLPISLMEELLLQLIYFIPLFVSPSFILIGLESNSFNYTLYSTLSLGFTLCLRYSLELGWIYLHSWAAFREKLPKIYLHLSIDVILLIVLLLYAKRRLRNKYKKNKCEMEEKVTPREHQPLMKDGGNVSKIHNDLSTSAPVKKNTNEELEKVQLHYPSITPINSSHIGKPLPKLPKDELDDISLPPPIPIALPDDYKEDDEE